MAASLVPLVLLAADRPPLAELEQRLAAQQAEIMRLQAAAAAEEARVAAQEAAADKAALEKAKSDSSDLARIKKMIAVTAPTTKQRDEVLDIAAKALQNDPFASRVFLNPSFGTSLARPLSITVTGGSRCWTSGGAIPCGGGGKACSVKIDIASHNDKVSDPYEYMLANCLQHEVLGHGVGIMRCGEAYNAMPRWAKEGVSVIHETPRTRAYYYDSLRDLMLKKGGLPFSVEALAGMMGYPPKKADMNNFYFESYALSDMLAARLAKQGDTKDIEGKNVETVLYFSLAAKEKGVPQALKEYPQFGIKSVAELESSLRSWIEEK